MRPHVYVAGLLLLLSLTLPFAAHSQQQAPVLEDTLFGITNITNSNNGVNNFDHIRPSDAHETVLGPIGGVTYSYVMGTYAYDPTTHDFFMIRVTTGASVADPSLIAVNTETGAVSVRGALQHNYIALGFMPATHTLFGITNDSDGNNRLAHINPITGAETIISAIGSTTYAYNGGAYAYDPLTQDFFMIRVTPFGPALNPTLIAVNTQTGAVSVRGALQYSYFSLGFMPTTGTLFGRTVYVNGIGRFMHIDPVTGTETEVSIIGDITYAYNCDVYDPATGDLFLQRVTPSVATLNPTLVTLDTKTGAITVRGPLQYTYMVLGFKAINRLYLPLVTK